MWGTRPYKMDDLTMLPQADADSLARALVRSPTWGEAWLGFAVRVLRPGRPETSRLAASCADQAGVCDPNNYLLWENIGRLRLGMGDKDGADAAFKRMHELREWKEPPNTEFRF